MAIKDDAILVIKKIYTNIGDCISDDGFIARHRQCAKDFTRNRTLTFRLLIMLLLNQLKGSLQDELDQFFQTLGFVPWGKRMFTAAALSKAKKKLKASAFV